MLTEREKQIKIYEKMALAASNMNRIKTAEFYKQKVKNLKLKATNRRGKV